MRTIRLIRNHFLSTGYFVKLFAALLLATSTWEACSESRNNDKSLSEILSQLDPARSETDRTKAAANLQHLGTNALTFLLAEMNSFKWHTPEEKNKTIISRTQRLRAAFGVLGTNLEPLTLEFVANLNTNHNFVSALDGLAAMRGSGAGYLVGAMTNREPSIRLNAVATVMEVGTNADIVKLAVPNLIRLLNDQSEQTRSIAAETLGLYCDEPNIVIPSLLKLARGDNNLVVRTQGVKAVGRIEGRFGSMDSTAKSTLEEISKHDESQIVRSCAERVLAGKDP
jgi:HEAT repeat protein